MSSGILEKAEELGFAAAADDEEDDEEEDEGFIWDQDDDGSRVSFAADEEEDDEEDDEEKEDDGSRVSFVGTVGSFVEVAVAEVKGRDAELACTTDALSSKSISTIGWKLAAIEGVGTV